VPQIRLQRLLNKHQQCQSIINDLTAAATVATAICDHTGRLVAGNIEACEAPASAPIYCNNEIIGRVYGGTTAATIAGLISFIAAQEADCKALANEVLDKYRELNLLYHLAEKMSITLGPAATAQLVLEEAHKLITADDGVIILRDEQKQAVEVMAAFGELYQPSGIAAAEQQLINDVLLAGKSEIINDVAADLRYGDSGCRMRSLLYSPLLVQQQFRGAIIIGSRALANYTAADLKLLNNCSTPLPRRQDRRSKMHYFMWSWKVSIARWKTK
jgi:hypothetical protein